MNLRELSKSIFSQRSEIAHTDEIANGCRQRMADSLEVLTGQLSFIITERERLLARIKREEESSKWWRDRANSLEKALSIQNGQTTRARNEVKRLKADAAQ